MLGTHAEQALVAAAGFDPAPALAALCEHAAREHPQAWRWDGREHLEALQLGWALQGDAVHGDARRRSAAAWPRCPHHGVRPDC